MLNSRTLNDLLPEITIHIFHDCSQRLKSTKKTRADSVVPESLEVSQWVEAYKDSEIYVAS